MDAKPPSSARIRELSEKHLLDVYPRRVMNIVLARGEGCRVTDMDGKSYLDFASANGVNVLGYGHPAVIAAAEEQLARIVQSGNYFYNVPQALLAKRLSELSGLDRVFFSNSGAEAVEAAIKIARRCGNRAKEGKSKLICFRKAWHGRTLATISATDDAAMQEGFGPLLPGFTAVAPWNMDAIRAAVDENTVGILSEPIIGHGGINVPPPGFFQELRNFCDQNQLLLILDEVQTAPGRTGTFFYYEQLGIKPDIVCLAKGLGAGFAIGATLCTETCAGNMQVGAHGSATGGNPFATHIAAAVVEILSKGNLLPEVRHKGALLLSGLQRLADRLPGIVTAARGFGMLAAVDITPSTLDILPRLSENGLLATRISLSCLRFMPPLIISEAEIDEGIEILFKTLSEFRK